MNRLLLPSTVFVLATLTAASFAQPQPPKSYYPAPPPEHAPVAEQGAPTADLTSPLPASGPKVDHTEIASDYEARLFRNARKIVWGRQAKAEGARPGELAVTREGDLWIVKGRIDSAAPGTEGDWASIDGVVKRISAHHVQLLGEVAFRVATVANGAPCKLAGLLNFWRYGKSVVWRLTASDNPCDGTRERFDLVREVHAKPVAKRPAPAQSKRD